MAAAETRLDALEGVIVLLMRTERDSDPLTGPMNVAGLRLLAEGADAPALAAEYRRLHDLAVAAKIG